MVSLEHQWDLVLELRVACLISRRFGLQDHVEWGFGWDWEQLLLWPVLIAVLRYQECDAVKY